MAGPGTEASTGTSMLTRTVPVLDADLDTWVRYGDRYGDEAGGAAALSSKRGPSLEDESHQQR